MRRQRIEEAFHGMAPSASVRLLKIDIFTIGDRDLRMLSG
jgi:hypothetical protein